MYGLIIDQCEEAALFILDIPLPSPAFLLVQLDCATLDVVDGLALEGLH